MVGLNSDASVRLCKGPSRPIVPEADRKAVLEAIWCVDEVILYDTRRPMELIEGLKPTFYVKGPECADRLHLPEMQLVRELGGTVSIPDWPITTSTTAILERREKDVRRTRHTPKTNSAMVWHNFTRRLQMQ